MTSQGPKSPMPAPPDDLDPTGPGQPKLPVPKPKSACPDPGGLPPKAGWPPPRPTCAWPLWILLFVHGHSGSLAILDPPWPFWILWPLQTPRVRGRSGLCWPLQTPRACVAVLGFGRSGPPVPGHSGQFRAFDPPREWLFRTLRTVATHVRGHRRPRVATVDLATLDPIRPGAHAESGSWSQGGCPDRAPPSIGRVRRSV